MPAFTDYSIAAGWNNAGSLVKIGLIVATSNLAFPEPAANAGFVPGIIKPRLDSRLATVGLNRQVWTLPGMTFEQYRYAQDTWCGGGFSGTVTIRTRWQNKAFANYNATLNIQHENLTPTFQGFASVDFTFLDLQVLA